MEKISCLAVFLLICFKTAVSSELKNSDRITKSTDLELEKELLNHNLTNTQNLNNSDTTNLRPSSRSRVMALPTPLPDDTVSDSPRRDKIEQQKVLYKLAGQQKTVTSTRTALPNDYNSASAEEDDGDDEETSDEEEEADDVDEDEEEPEETRKFHINQVVTKVSRYPIMSANSTGKLEVPSKTKITKKPHFSKTSLQNKSGETKTGKPSGDLLNKKLTYKLKKQKHSGDSKIGPKMPLMSKISVFSTPIESGKPVIMDSSMKPLIAENLKNQIYEKSEDSGNLASLKMASKMPLISKISVVSRPADGMPVMLESPIMTESFFLERPMTNQIKPVHYKSRMPEEYSRKKKKGKKKKKGYKKKKKFLKKLKRYKKCLFPMLLALNMKFLLLKPFILKAIVLLVAKCVFMGVHFMRNMRTTYHSFDRSAHYDSIDHDGWGKTSSHQRDHFDDSFDKRRRNALSRFSNSKRRKW